MVATEVMAAGLAAGLVAPRIVVPMAALVKSVFLHTVNIGRPCL